jgi:hypothetical protein
MSGRVSRVMHASPDPSPIVTQPAGRHPALKPTFVYISSEEVDIGELSLTMISQSTNSSGTVKHTFELV